MRTKIFAVLLLSTLSALAQSKEAPPPPGAPRDFTIPAVRKLTLSNGLQVRLVAYGDIPKVVVRLVTHTGNIDEQATEVWLADLTASMMEQGTATRSADQIAREAALMGGSLSVDVALNQTTASMDVFSESASPAIALLADVVRHPAFAEKDLPRLKTDLARNLALARSQPQSLAQERLVSALFPNHAYGRMFPTEAMVQGYTIAQVLSFHERNFGAARSFLYVAGRFDDAKVEEAIRAAFGDWKAGEPRSKVSVAPVSRRAVYFIDRPGAVQSTLRIGIPTLDATSPDYLGFTVMNALLGGSFGSRITSNIREQKGYTYSPSSAATTWLGAGWWAENADVTTNVTGPAIREILSEITRLRTAAPSEAELRGIQNYLAGTFVLRNSSRSGLAAQLAFLDLYGLGEDYLRNYVQRVYALTPVDVQRLAATYLDPDKLAIVVVGDPGVLEQVKGLGDVVR